MPGIYISMKSLHENRAKLSPVNIIKPEEVIGTTTTNNIQSGLYYSHLGAVREVISRISTSFLQNINPVIIGTSRFAHLFELEGLHLTAKLC